MKLFYFLFFVLLSFFCNAQSSYQFGVLPSINVNKKLPQNFKLNCKLSSRHLLKKGFFEKPSDFKYQYLLTDFAVLAARKVGFHKSLALGYLIRLKEGKTVHRSIQQFIITKSYTGVKLSHRITSDQTYEAEERTSFRLRYRLSSAIALQGHAVDSKEFYLKLNNEYLNFWQSKSYDLEIRILALLGYQFTDQKKVELGLDYRINSFIANSSENRFWISINWYQVL